MNTRNEKVFKLIQVILDNRKCVISNDQDLDISYLLSEGVIELDGDKNLYKIVEFSKIFYENLLRFVEQEVGSELPLDIVNSISFINEFDLILKKDQKQNIINEFNYIIEPLKQYLLIYLQNKKCVDVFHYLEELKGNSKEHDRGFLTLQRLFFKSLPFMQMDTEKLAKIILISIYDEKTKYLAMEFASDLGRINKKKAIELLGYLKIKELSDIDYLISNLMIGLHKNGYKEVSNDARILQKNRPLVTANFFGRIEYSDTNELKECVDLFKDINKNDDSGIIRELFYLYMNILKSKYVDEEIIVYCFSRYRLFFENTSEDDKSYLVHILSWNIDGYEKERFEILIFILEQNSNFGIIKDYFSNFKNPDYFFHLFISLNINSSFRNDLTLFKNGLNYFWGVSKEETESKILILLCFEEYKIRRSIVQLILNCSFIVQDLDLLKLDTEQKQLRAVEVILNHPIEIENLLSAVIVLRNSSFPLVVTYLKEKLCVLVFESYHQYLYDLITKHLAQTKEDIAFLKPITKYLKKYKRQKKAKEKIKELDPRENEKDLMNLFYSVDHESNSKLIRDARGKGDFFMNRVKNTVIVRGDSWKIDGQVEINPLRKFKSEFVLNKKTFKDPDLYEYYLENFKSNF